MTDAAEWLAARAHSVDVVTAMPNYPERAIHPEYRGVFWKTEQRGDVRVHRSWLRAKPERSFFDKALYELTVSTFALPNAMRLARRADVMLCVVPTVLAARYAAAVARTFRKRLVLWVQDLVLAAAPSVGDGAAASRVLSAAQRLERSAFRAAAAIVVCSPGFRSYVLARGVDGTRVEVIPNWADLDWIRPTAPHGNGRTARFLYAGNLGYTQGLGTLIDAARIGGDRVAVEIVGGGNAAAEVRRLAESVPNVAVRDPVERAAYPELLGSADAHVVIQRRISAGANLPSKIATYMASGRPIVAAIDAATPAAEILRQSRGAILVEPEMPAALAAAMQRLAADVKLRLDLGKAARAYAEEHFAKTPALERLEGAILGC